jgi:hypothetical protein
MGLKTRLEYCYFYKEAAFDKRWSVRENECTKETNLMF